MTVYREILATTRPIRNQTPIGIIKQISAQNQSKSNLQENQHDSNPNHHLIKDSHEPRWAKINTISIVINLLYVVLAIEHIIPHCHRGQLTTQRRGSPQEEGGAFCANATVLIKEDSPSRRLRQLAIIF